MRITNEKGFMFSLDLLLAFFIMCAMLYFMLLHLDFIAERNARALEEFSFYQNAFSFADSSVKSSLAFYDGEKRRLLDNVLDYGLLKEGSAQKPENMKFSIIEIALVYANGKRETIIRSSEETKNGCPAVERLVRVRKNPENEKAKISFLFCGAEK